MTRSRTSVELTASTAKRFVGDQVRLVLKEDVSTFEGIICHLENVIATKVCLLVSLLEERVVESVRQLRERCAGRRE
jgi:hypothetical protein